MNPASSCPRAAPIGPQWMLAHLALCVAALVAMLAWPPASGMILAIPFGTSNPATLARAAGLRLVRRGPLPGSLVIFGSRHAIATRAWQQEILLVAAGAINCGPGKANR